MIGGRIGDIAPVGSLLKGSTPARTRKKDLGRAPRERDEAHLSAIRKCQCLYCGLDAGCEAAHVRMSRGRGTGGGMGMKPSDKFTVPLCVNCHREQHSVGEQTFWDSIDLDPLWAADKIYSVSPDVTAMRAVVGALKYYRG